MVSSVSLAIFSMMGTASLRRSEWKQAAAPSSCSLMVRLYLSFSRSCRTYPSCLSVLTMRYTELLLVAISLDRKVIPASRSRASSSSILTALTTVCAGFWSSISDS